MLLLPSLAAAQSSEKKNAIENLASLMVASRWCKDYTVDEDKIGPLAIAAKINLKDNNEKELFRSKITEHEKIMGESGSTAYCAYAYKVFGPGGNIAGFMMKK